MQFITITGRVGGDAETRSAGNGTVTSFSCAVDQGWGDRKKTNWFRVSIWGERGAKLEQYIKKGDKLTATGELEIGEYQGKPQYEIRAADVDCFMAKREGGGGATPQATSDRRPAPDAFNDLDDDVPFISASAEQEWKVG